MCATASTVIDTIKAENLVAKAKQTGKYLHDGFFEKLSTLDGVRNIRGIGLMIGIELDTDCLKYDCTELVKLALEKHLLINVTAGNVIRLLPPLIINQQQADTIINTVTELVTNALQKKAVA